MPETINGSNEAVQNREVISFTPNIGGEYGGKYEGPKLKVKEKMQELILAGFAVQYECDQSPVATLTFKTPGNGSGSQPPAPNVDYTDNFQVLRNTVAKELLMSEHPLVSGVDAANMRQLQDLIATPQEIDYDSGGVATKITGTRTWSGSGSPTSSATRAQYLLDLYLNGVRSVEVKQPVLRVTRVTNPLFDVPFDLSYVDRVLSTGTMISDSGVPSNFAIGLVALANACSWRTTLNGSGYAVRTDNIGLKFGWLKDAVTSETVGTTKNQYVLEYKFGLYDVEIYGEPV